MVNEEGFTLLEVLIAVVILAISFSILIQGFAGALAGVEKQQDYTFLSGWAEGKLIELSRGIELNGHGRIEQQGREYRWWLEETFPAEDLRQIIIIVEWQGRSGLNHYSTGRIIPQQE